MPSQGSIYLRDVSGNIALLDTSGRVQVNLAGGSVTSNISGQTVILGSGTAAISGQISVLSGVISVLSGVITASVSSGAVSVASGNISIQSGAISVVSGSITVNSGQVAVSGLYTAATLISGAGGISGIGAQALFVYDYSGSTWNPMAVATSGGNHPFVTIGSATPAPSIVSIAAANVDTANPAFTTYLTAGAIAYGFEPGASVLGRIRASVSGDQFRLRVSAEGRAPTYSVNAQAITLFSGSAVQSAPYIALMNFGSGTATPVYKIKGLFIGPDASNALVSGQAIKFDAIRFTAFSGGGTLLSGVAMDTNDPAYSGTLAGPTLMKNCGSGVTLDGVYFSYITSTEGPFNAAASALTGENSVFDPGTVQNTNLIALRMPDTKEVVIRSGFGFGVVQSSGNSYTQLTSGAYSFSMIYSVEA